MPLFLFLAIIPQFVRAADPDPRLAAERSIMHRCQSHWQHARSVAELNGIPPRDSPAGVVIAYIDSVCLGNGALKDDPAYFDPTTPDWVMNGSEILVSISK